MPGLTHLDKAVQQVLDALDRWDERLRQHYEQKQAHPRASFRSRIEVHPVDRGGATRSVHPDCGIQGWSRNLSRSGLSFILDRELECDRVLICLNPDTGRSTWKKGEVMRARRVQNDFFEYGVRFIQEAAESL